MKPLLISTFDTMGAAKACIRLHNGLLAQNIDSVLQVLYKSDPTVKSCVRFNDIVVDRSLSARVSRKIDFFLTELGLKSLKESDEVVFLKKRSKELEMFSFPVSKYDITLSNAYKNCDVVNLHWVANYLDFPSFFTKNKKPIVWTLHDMNPFTGGEHYIEKQIGINEKGYPYTRIYTAEELEHIKTNLEIKERVLSTVKNLTIVTPSHWLQEEAKNSEIFGQFNVVNIPYGINTSIFKPRDKTLSRELLDLPKDKIIVLFVADSVSIKRKGFDYLLRAMPLIANKDVHFCSVGKNSCSEFIDNSTSLGPIMDERLMSVAYSAADVFVIPSLMDNLPNTVIESLCCGTPVIGFPTGGICDMVDDGKNGLLCTEISVSSLADNINKFVSIYSFDRIKISEDAHKTYNQDIPALNYIKLYEKILNDN